MRATSAWSQLALGWSADDGLRWDELPASLQAEVRELLRRLLVAAASEGRAEMPRDSLLAPVVMRATAPYWRLPRPPP